jgi:hypothetical protein
MCSFKLQRGTGPLARLIVLVSAVLILPVQALADCGTWTDLGRNTRLNGANFNTSNGTHFATDGTNLYLLEGSNGPNFDWFNPATSRYEPKAGLPEGDEDGGELQYADGAYYAGSGLGFNHVDGTGRGRRLWIYHPTTNTWTAGADCQIGGFYYAHEALAFDPVGHRLFATIDNRQDGSDPTALSKLAIYNVASNTWTGFTAAAPDTWGGGSEAEYLDGKIYVWQGGWGGANADGSDSYLDVYDIASNSWSTTATLKDAGGVSPGFRTGPSDVWGVSMTADAAHKQLLITGAEGNSNLYIYDVASGIWSLGPVAVYDGGWGGSLEYVAGAQKLYQIDGRNASGGAQLQGSASLDMSCPRPTADAGPDQSLPGSCSALTPVTLTGTVTGTYTSVKWIDDNTGQIVGTSLSTVVQLPPGVFSFTFGASANGFPSFDKVVVTLTGGHTAPPVTIPMSAQINDFGPDFDTIVPGSALSFLLEIPAADTSSGWEVGPWTRQWLTGGDRYRTPRINLRNACYGVVDLSNVNVSVTHRYLQDSLSYNDPLTTYTDSTVSLSFFDRNGKRGALCNQHFDPNDPNTGGRTHWPLTWPNHRTADPNATNQVIYSANVLDGLELPPFLTYSNHLYFDGVLDSEGTQAGFDPTAIVAVEFFGTDSLGQGYDLLDLKDLSFTAAGPTVHCGDANCDGLVNNGDIDAFVMALTDPATYATTYGCSANCDTNGDSLVNNGYIDSFVAAVVAGGCL